MSNVEITVNPLNAVSGSAVDTKASKDTKDEKSASEKHETESTFSGDGLEQALRAHEQNQYNNLANLVNSMALNLQAATTQIALLQKQLAETEKKLAEERASRIAALEATTASVANVTTEVRRTDQGLAALTKKQTDDFWLIVRTAQAGLSGKAAPASAGIAPPLPQAHKSYSVPPANRPKK